MHESEVEILPEFIYTDSKGEISNRSSIITNHTPYTSISTNNTITTFNIHTSTQVSSITDYKTGRITSTHIFSFQNTQYKCVGTESGTVKIYENDIKTKQYRPHTKRVTTICNYENFLISSSIDGSMVKYDIFDEAVKIFFKTTKVAIFNARMDRDIVAANCGDFVIRYWNVDNEDCVGVNVFNEEILDFVMFDEYVVVFCCNGESVVTDMNNNYRKQFNVFNKIRAVKKFNDFLYVLCCGKFVVYRMNVKNGLVLQDVGSYKVDKYFHDFDVRDVNDILFLSYKNKIVSMNLKDSIEFKICFHENEIFNVIAMNKKIVTCSEEKYIVWKAIDDKIEKLHSCEFDYVAKQICLFGSIILIGSDNSVYFYDSKNNALIKRLNIAVSVIHLNKNTLFVGKGCDLSIYEINMNENNTLNVNLIDQRRFSYEISFVNSSDNQLYYGLSFYDNTLKIFDFRTHENMNILYGHSLPIRYFTFSPNSGTILTCGSDKLVKLWGTQFGECRKTFIGDAQNISYITNKGFIFCDGEIKYFKNHSLIRKYRGFDHSIVFYTGDMLIVGLKYGLLHYKTGLYEIDDKLPDSQEIEDEILHELKITDGHIYEKLVEELNKIESGQKENFFDLYMILKYINLAEIDKFIYFMTEPHLKLILKCLNEFYTMFPVTAIRIFVNIGRIYGYLCRNDENVFALYENMREMWNKIKEMIGTDMMEMVTI